MEESEMNEKRIYMVLMELARDTRLQEMSQYMQHGDTSVYKHCIAVAYESLALADRYHIKTDKLKLIRGALLHDYFLYDWHEHDKSHCLHGFRHPFTAARNAKRDTSLSQIEEDIIRKHMFPLVPVPPKYKESIIVCIADKICSTYETTHRDLKSPLYQKADHMIDKVQKK